MSSDVNDFNRLLRIARQFIATLRRPRNLLLSGLAVGMLVGVILGWYSLELHTIRRHLENIDVHLSRETNSVAGRLDAIESELARRAIGRQEIAEQLRRSSVALGVKFHDTSGKVKVVWKGSGFVVSQSPYCGTAAHVLEQMSSLEGKMTQQGLHPCMVAKGCDGGLRVITSYKLHAGFPDKGERDSAAPTTFFLERRRVFSAILASMPVLTDHVD